MRLAGREGREPRDVGDGPRTRPGRGKTRVGLGRRRPGRDPRLREGLQLQPRRDPRREGLELQLQLGPGRRGTAQGLARTAVGFYRDAQDGPGRPGTRPRGRGEDVRRTNPEDSGDAPWLGAPLSSNYAHLAEWSATKE